MQLFLHDADGRITQGLSGAMNPDDLNDLRARGFSFVVAPDNASQATNYVVDGQLVARPVADIRITKTEFPANKRARATITGLPDPCTLFIDGEPVAVDGGRLELTADMPATYSIAFDQFPFMPWSAEITAT
jgi:hypothetical protein